MRWEEIAPCYLVHAALSPLGSGRPRCTSSSPWFPQQIPPRFHFSLNVEEKKAASRRLSDPLLPGASATDHFSFMALAPRAVLSSRKPTHDCTHPAVGLDHLRPRRAPAATSRRHATALAVPRLAVALRDPAARSDPGCRRPLGLSPTPRAALPEMPAFRKRRSGSRIPQTSSRKTGEILQLGYCSPNGVGYSRLIESCSAVARFLFAAIFAGWASRPATLSHRRGLE
jgi:hypothetical protein